LTFEVRVTIGQVFIVSVYELRPHSSMQIVRTEAPKHAVDIARSSTADVIICVSGDGIVHEVV
jgi:diacylglycerol kinase family enzyme